MRAVAAFLALAQAAVSVTYALANAEPAVSAITFEAWNGTEIETDNLFMALEAAATTASTTSCKSSQLKVLVRISSCFTRTEMEAIESWAATKLSPASLYFSNGQAIDFKYSARLAANKAGNKCPAGSTTAGENVLAQALSGPSFLSTGEVPHPDAVITISKGATVVVDLSSAVNVHYKIRVCPDCTPTAGETLVGGVGSLNAGTDASFVRSIPCSSTAGAVATTITDSNKLKQCTCECPVGYSVSAGSCVKNTISTDTCYWDGTGTGYKCEWKDTKTSLKLVDDCGAAVLKPKDNYVNDARVNHYDSPLSSLADPMIKVDLTTSAGSTSTPVKTTWLDFVSNPKSSLNGVTFNEFGVYSLSMTATDYTQSATCTGCVAVVDKYRPTAITACQTTTFGATTLNPAKLTATGLAAAKTQEDNFYAFSDSSNVQNNAPSTHFVVDSQTKDDFVSTTSNSATDLGYCFDDNIVKQLLTQTKSNNPLTSGRCEGELSQLTCKRCCSKTKTLKEKYYEYSCAAGGTFSELTGDGSSCSFSHCVYVPATTLVTAAAATSSASNTASQAVLDDLLTATTRALASNKVHRTSTCETLGGAGCGRTETLGNLFDLSSSWNSDIPGATIDEATFPQSEHVFWRYKIGTGAWKQWANADKVEFTQSSTSVRLEAWTTCGLVKGFDFVYVLHTHSEITTCNSFAGMWLQLPTNTLTSASGGFCAYPDSDFAPLQFKFSGAVDTTNAADTVKAKFSNVACKVKVTDKATSFSRVTATSLPLPTTSDPISKYFGVELVSAPMTDEYTKVFADCTFTFHPYDVPITDLSKDKTKQCTYDFTVRDCTKPTLSKDDGVCADGKCMATGAGSPSGPYEACKGDVFTTYDQVTTTLKTSAGCCADCENGKTLVCKDVLPNSIDSDYQIGRCEPQTLSSFLTVSALAEENEADQEENVEAESTATSTTISTLLGASAMVAVVALVAVNRRAGAAAARAKADDDAYYPLLD